MQEDRDRYNRFPLTNANLIQATAMVRIFEGQVTAMQSLSRRGLNGDLRGQENNVVSGYSDI